MDNREMLLESLNYNLWANLESLSSVHSATNVPDRALAVIAHIPGAEQVWLERVRKTGSPTIVWPHWDLEETERQIRAAARDWRELLLGVELDSRVTYSNSKGESFANTVEEIARHVFFHGAYHRGQIATLLRSAGSSPVLTDYIHYIRTINSEMKKAS